MHCPLCQTLEPIAADQSKSLPTPDLTAADEPTVQFIAANLPKTLNLRLMLSSPKIVAHQPKRFPTLDLDDLRILIVSPILRRRGKAARCHEGSLSESMSCNVVK